VVTELWREAPAELAIELRAAEALVVESFEGLEDNVGTFSVDAELTVLALVATLMFDVSLLDRVVLAEGLFAEEALEALETEERVVTPDIAMRSRKWMG
jgi:hypothetical protein